MRRLFVLGMLVAAVVLYFAAPASAIFLIPGELTASLSDASTLYVDHDGDPATPRMPRLPRDAGPFPDPGALGQWQQTNAEVSDEQRSLINIDLLEHLNDPYYAPPFGELTGLMYDLHVARADFTVNAAGHLIADLYFDALNRNPLALDADCPIGSGGVAEIWLDPTPENVPDDTALYDPFADGLAPFYWSEAGGPADPAHFVTGFADGYPTVNMGDDSTLWLAMVFTPQGMIIDPVTGALIPYLIHEQFNLTLGTGSLTQVGLNIVGGSAQGQFTTGLFGPGIDFTGAATFELPPNAVYFGSAQDQGNWAVRSHDPLHADVLIPEPATMTLLGLGLLGLGVRLRRRK